MDAAQNNPPPHGACPVCKGPRRAAYHHDHQLSGYRPGDVVHDRLYRGPVGHSVPIHLRNGKEKWFWGTEVCFECWACAWSAFAKKLEGWHPQTKLAMALNFHAEGYTQEQAAGLAGLAYRTFKLKLHEIRDGKIKIENILAQFRGSQ